MWSYKITNVSMRADWIELFVEYTTPSETKFTKMYNLTQAMSQEQINDFVIAQVANLEALSTNYELLSSMVGTDFNYEGIVTDENVIVEPSFNARLTALEDVIMMLLV
jgi:hypothetical protein